MKTFTRISMMCISVVLITPAWVQAQDFRSPNLGRPGYQAPAKTFLGLPLPQQWTGARSVPMHQYHGNAVTSRSTNYGPASTCAHGQCATGRCANGRCTTGNGVRGYGVTGQTTNGSCANGQCRQTQSSGVRSNSNRNADYDVQDNLSQRTTRSNMADPFRGAEFQDQDVNRTQRPSMRNPVNDLYPSRYNSDDLDLRRPYFNNQSGELHNNRASENSSAGRDTRAPLPMSRSLIGIPADLAHGVAQI
ncbi:MAG: hypothetical protein O2856_10470 [Planctomycetota bacterium]|nr:hypothetical protein [Planctomycetota bacterium]